MSDEEEVQPPHDTDLERALLCCVLQASNQERQASAVEALRRAAQAMFSDRYRRVAEVMLGLADAGEWFDPLILIGELRAQKIDPEIVGEILTAGLPPGSSVSARWYADKLLRLAWRRNVMTRSRGLKLAASNGVSDRDVSELLRDLADEAPPNQNISHEGLSEILARPEPEQEWLVQGTWTHPEVSIIHGDGGIGKTWIALHIMACLASGAPVFGRLAVPKPRRVAYLDLERGSAALDYRLHRIAKLMGLTRESVERIHIIRERAVLDDPEDARRIVEHCKRLELEWLCVDSWQAAIVGNDCDATDINRLMRSCLYPLRDSGCSAFVLDHERKARGDSALDAPAESLHGSKRKRNSVESTFQLRKRGTELLWNPDKANHHEPAERLRLELREGGAMVVALGALDPASDGAQDSVIAVLRRAGGPVYRKDLLEMTKDQLGGSTVARAIRDLEAQGKITAGKDGRRAYYVVL